MSRRDRNRARADRPSSDALHPVGVLFERLELSGLQGVGTVELRFPPGLGTLARPNEWGKSAVVEGLTAVLFGPPPAADDRAEPVGVGAAPAATSAAGPAGRLTFVGADGRRFRLERDLASGAGRLVPEGEGTGAGEDGAGWEDAEAVEGGDLEPALEAVLGLGARKAFVESFCVTQPLPRAEGLSAEVQRLLVGSGRGGVERALARLGEEALHRTRRGRGWGLPDGDQDGELERCDARLEELADLLREGREAADGAQEAARALAEAEARRARHGSEGDRLDGEIELLRSYLARRRAYEERLEAQSAAAQTLARAEALEAEAGAAHARASAVWPELAGAPDDVEARLTALVSAERKLAETSAAVQVAERALEEARRVAVERSRTLEHHTADAPFGDDEGLTLEAAQGLRTAAEQAVADWRAFLEREEGIGDARDALRPYAMLALAPEQDRALLRRYDYEAESRVRAVEGLEAAVREARAERRRLLVPEPELPNDLEAEDLRASLAGSGRKARAVARQAVVSLASGGVVLWVMESVSAAGPSAALAALVALGVAVLLRPPVVSGPRLRRFRGLPRTELERLLQRYDAWRAQPVPTRRDVLRLENEMEAARDQLRAFQRRMQPYQEAYPEPGSAFDAFREAQRTLLQREELHRELTSRTLGAAPGDVRDRSPLDMPAPWPRLAAFAEARGGAVRSVGDLCSSLADLGEAGWAEVLGAAGERDAARRAFREERERLRREVAIAETVLEEREATATGLRAELRAAREAQASLVEPLSALLVASGAGAAELLGRWRERDRAVQEAERSFDALASMLAAADCESLDGLRSRVAAREEEAREERAAVEQLAGEASGLPAPDAPVERSRLLDRLEALEERLAFERAARQAAEAEVYERTRALAALQARPTVNLAKAQEERAAAARRRERLLDELGALSVAHAELRAAVADFQASFRERLEGLASEHFATLTATPGRGVRLRDDFTVSVMEPDGEERPPERLSRGAQDQLALAVRLAVADHVADDIRLPLVLDDPFVLWDASRLSVLRTGLERVARQRQILLLTHDESMVSWGAPIEVS